MAGRAGTVTRLRFSKAGERWPSRRAKGMAQGTAGRSRSTSWPRYLPFSAFLLWNRTAPSSHGRSPSAVHCCSQLSDCLPNHGMATSQHLSVSERPSGPPPANTSQAPTPCGLQRPSSLWQSKAWPPPMSDSRIVSLAPQSLAIGSGLVPCPQLPRPSAGPLAGLSTCLPLRCPLL